MHAIGDPFTDFTNWLCFATLLLVPRGMASQVKVVGTIWGVGLLVPLHFLDRKGFAHHCVEVGVWANFIDRSRSFMSGMK